MASKDMTKRRGAFQLSQAEKEEESTWFLKLVQ